MENLDKVYAESIAKEYTPKSDSKVVALKKLDKKAKMPASIFGYTFGNISALVAGVGMCLSMHVIGPVTVGMLVLGIIIGIVGFAGVSINYPSTRRSWTSPKRSMLRISSN